MKNLALDNSLSPRKYLFLITWPIFIEVFLQMLMNLTDVFMISFISDEAVAAIGVVNQLMHFTFVLFNFTAMGSGVVVSQYVGANNPKGIRKTITHALILNLIFGLVISLFVGLNRHFLLNLFSLEPSLYAYAESYTLIVGLALFAQAMILTVSSILQAMGFTKDVMVTVLMMNVLNVIGNYVFIFGAGFIPQLGVPGVAIATAGSRIVIMLWLFIVLFKRIDIKMKWRDFFNLEKEYSSKILGIGIPSAGEQLSYNLSQIIVTMMITTLGATALATRVYSQNLMSVLTIIAVSMSKGMQIFIGQLIGAKKQDTAYDSMFMGLKYSTIMTIAIATVIALFRRQVLSIFTDDPGIIALGAVIIIIEFILQPARTGNMVIISALRAAGDAVFPVKVGIAIMWGVMLPLAYVLGIYLGLGLPGIWLALMVDEWVRSIIMYRRWKNKRWQGKALA